MLNPLFLNNCKAMLGDSYSDFVLALDTPVSTSIRYNPYKVLSEQVGDRVPWSRYGYYLEERPRFTLDPLFHAGTYYVQESSSMFIEQIIKQYLGEDHAPVMVLDMCAAPGGKTTHIASLVGLDSLVVANEAISSRASILVENAKKWGTGNIVVTNNDPKSYSKIKGLFDILIVDAPCSGEGMFRKNIKARDEWSPSNVDLCSERSRRILSDSLGCLKEGGLLIYSTCTFNEQENEETLLWLEQTYDISAFNVSPSEDWNIQVSQSAGINGYRFYPHKQRGEGFFVSAMVKNSGKRFDLPKRKERSMLTKKEIVELDSWLVSDILSYSNYGDSIHGIYEPFGAIMDFLKSVLNVRYYGIEMGKLYHGELKPAHPLALYHDINKIKVNMVNVDLESALNYLRKESVDVQLFEESINMVCYNDSPLGYVKRISNRCNNMYPTSMRIYNL